MKLYAWFAEHHSFCLSTDEKKLLDGLRRKKFERKEELAAIKCALKQLENLDMIGSSTVEDDQVWVLKKGFETLNQTIELSSETCLSVSLIVNGFCEVVGNKTDKCDPKSITEGDVKNLLFVASYLMDNNPETSDKPPEEGKE